MFIRDVRNHKSLLYSYLFSEVDDDPEMAPFNMEFLADLVDTKNEVSFKIYFDSSVSVPLSLVRH